MVTFQKKASLAQRDPKSQTSGPSLESVELRVINQLGRVEHLEEEEDEGLMSLDFDEQITPLLAYSSQAAFA